MVVKIPPAFRISKDIALNSFDIIDLTTGRSIQKLYAYDTVAGKPQDTQKFLLSNVVQYASSGAIGIVTAGATIINQNFDFAVKNPMYLEGDGSASFTVGLHNGVGSGQDLNLTFVTASLLHVRAGVETILGSGAISINGLTVAANSSLFRRRTVAFPDIVKTKFLKDDTLRLNMKTEDGENNASIVFSIACDPKNRTAITDIPHPVGTLGTGTNVWPSTELVVFVPIIIDV